MKFARDLTVMLSGAVWIVWAIVSLCWFIGQMI